jgi:hypothetical protein
MADYINKNILCQAYLHVEGEESEGVDTANVLPELRDFAATRAEFFLYPEVELDTSSKEGSLIVYVTVLGTIGALIIKYPEFRAGVIAIYDDVKRFSEYLVSEGLFKTHSRRKEIVRVEARTGVIGSLRKIVSDIDSVRRENGVRSERWMAERLEKIGEQIDVLRKNLHSEEDRELVREGLRQMILELPKLPAVRLHHTRSDEHASAYVAFRRELLNKLAE